MSNVFNTAKGISLSQVISRYAGVNLPAKKVNGLACPFCGHNGCFGLYGTKKNTLDKFKCFSCGKQGNSIDFVMEAKDYSEPAAAAKDICDTFGLKYEDSSANISNDFKNYIEVYKFCTDFFNMCYWSVLNNNINYFSDRGITPEVGNEFGLGYCPAYFTTNDNKVIGLKDILVQKFPKINMDDYGLYDSQGRCVFADRYIFPIKDVYGNVVAFAGRSLNEGGAKYKNTANNKFFNKSCTLFNYNVAHNFSTVYVVEGYMDALSLYQSGIKNVVASMGTAFNSSLLKGKNIILSLDNDDAGKTHMINIIEKNRDKRFSVLLLDHYKDFNEALVGKVDLKKFVSQTDCLDAPDFLILYLKTHTDLSLLANRSMCWKRMAKLIGNEKRPGYPINNIYTPIEYDYYWKHLSRLLKGGK